MNKILVPAGLVLVGAAFIFLHLAVTTAFCAEGAALPELPDLAGQLRESVSMQRSQEMRHSDPGFAQGSEPLMESITLSEGNSSCQVPELVAVNSMAERNIVCNEIQSKELDVNGTGNRLAIGVSGKEPQSGDPWPDASMHDDLGEDLSDDMGRGEDIELIVDRALSTGAGAVADAPADAGAASGAVIGGSIGSNGGDRLGNSLTVDVHGITVSALNTAEGGSAIATRRSRWRGPPT